MVMPLLKAVNQQLQGHLNMVSASGLRGDVFNVSTELPMLSQIDGDALAAPTKGRPC